MEVNLLEEPKSKASLTLGGKVYELPALDLNLMIALEEKFGSLQGVLDAIHTQKLSPLRDLLSILLRKYPELTPENIGSMINPSNLEDVLVKAIKSLGG